MTTLARVLVTAALALAASSAASAQTLLFEWTQRIGRNSGPPLNNWLPTWAVVSGDLDGDGDEDIVTAIPQAGYVRPQILINDGDGRFRDESSRRAPRVFNLGLVLSSDLGDVDLDGDLDLVIGTTVQGATWKGPSEILLLNDGKGFFSDASAKQLPTTQNQTSDIALVDIDGDKDLDMILASFTGHPGSNRVYVNNGKGVFTDETFKRMPFGQFWSRGLATGDVDRDGDVDLVFVSGTGSSVNASHQNWLYLNDGKGVFTWSKSALPTRKDQSTDVVLADFDGDRDLDLFVSGAVGKVGGRTVTDSLLLNNGKGIFTDVNASLPAKPHARYWGGAAAASVDFDGDGDLDVITADGSIGSGALFQNDGKARFTYVPAGYALGHGYIQAYAVADFDADGDPDVAATGLGIEINLNLRRQVVTRIPPKLGGPYPLELHAKPGRKILWAFSSLGRGKLPIPGLGTFGLDPRVLLAWPPRFPNAAGQTTIPVTLPNDKRLLGQTLSTQALVYDVVAGGFEGFSNVASDLVK